MSAPNARKGISVMILCSFSWLMLACILLETSTKRHQQCWHLALVNRPFCSWSGLSSRLSDFCWFCYSLDSQLKADRSPLPSIVDCHSPSFFVNCPCLLSDLPFLIYFQPRRRSRVQALCLGLAPKQTKRSSAWRTTYIVSHRLSQRLYNSPDS